MIRPWMALLALVALAAAGAAEAPGSGVEADALARLREGDRRGAIEVLEAAVAGGTATSEARALLGAVYLDLDRPEKALEQLEPLGRSAEADAVTLFNLGRALLAMERPAEAEEILRRAVAEAPRSRATLLLASLYAERRENRQAAATLRPLVEGEAAALLEEEDPELAGDVALLLGRSLAAAGEPGAALPHLERATRLLPDRAEAWQARGEALTELELLEQAYEALQRARELAEIARQREIADAEEARAEVRKATELFSRGRQEEALAALRRAIRLAPREPLPRTLEVRLLLDMGRTPEALEVADGLVRLTRGDAEALHLRGMAHLHLEDLAAAEEDFRAVLEEAPRHRAAMNALAVVRAQRGDRAEAQRLLERVLDLWPDDEVARRTLELLRQEG